MTAVAVVPVESGDPRPGPSSRGRSGPRPLRPQPPDPRPAQVTLVDGEAVAEPGGRHARGIPKRHPPVIRLGLAWTAVLLGALVISPAVGALVLAPVAAVAALTASRRRESGTARPWWLAAGCGGIPPLVALAGPVPATVAVVGGGVILAAIAASGQGPRRQVNLALCAVAPAAGAVSVVLACRQSVTIGLSLVAAVSLFDASNHLMGVGETGGLLGALAGALSLALLALLFAGILVVPFSGASPWLLCASTAIGAPIAVGLGNRMVGPGRLPAWRRLDSYFIAGPVWVMIASFLVTH